MTYRGIVTNGTIVFDGETPGEGTVVDVIPRPAEAGSAGDLINHPSFGIWKDRTDLPEDSVEASKMLRQKMMRRDDE